MRRNGVAAVAALALVGVVAGTKRTVNWAQRPYHNAIRGTLSANLEISVHPGICVVTGRVRGNVTVRRASPCGKASRYVALSLNGGRIDGRVTAAGKRCVMVWLFGGGVVKGGIHYQAAGNLGFLGNHFQQPHAAREPMVVASHSLAESHEARRRSCCLGRHCAGIFLL
jgi:hypothetical protein